MFETMLTTIHDDTTSSSCSSSSLFDNDNDTHPSTNRDIDIDLEQAESLIKPPPNFTHIELSDTAPSIEPPAPAPTPTTLPHLHGLRALAALSVYTSHHISWFYGPGSELEHGFGYHGEYHFATFPLIRTLYTGGAASVAIFFVLSGYVLSVSTITKWRLDDELKAIDAQSEKSTIRQSRLAKVRSSIAKRKSMLKTLLAATLRRPFRLYIPLALISLLFALMLHLPFNLAPILSWPEAEPTIPRELTKWSYELIIRMNPFCRYGGDAPWFPYDPPAWTMSAEFKGSLYVYFLLGIVGFKRGRRVRPWLFGMIGIVMLFAGEWVGGCFMFGVVIAIVNHGHPTHHQQHNAQHLGRCDQLPTRHRPWHRRLPIHLHLHKLTHSIPLITIFHSFLFITAWFLASMPSDPNPEMVSTTPGYSVLITHLTPTHYLTHEHYRFWHTISAAILIYSLSSLPLLQRLLSFRPIQFLGKISFSLYLVHIPIIWTVGDKICRMLGSRRMENEEWWDDKLWIPDLGPKGLSTRWLVSQAVIFPFTILISMLAEKYFDRPGVWIGKWVVEKTGLGKGAAKEGRGASNSSINGDEKDRSWKDLSVRLKCSGTRMQEILLKMWRNAQLPKLIFSRRRQKLQMAMRRKGTGYEPLKQTSSGDFELGRQAE